MPLLNPEDNPTGIGRVTLPPRLELLRPGELIESARDDAREADSAIAAGDHQLDAAVDQSNVGAGDVVGLEQFSDAFFEQGAAPDLRGEYSGFVEALGDGDMRALADGDMPGIPTPQGDPPPFYPDDAGVNPDELPEQPEYPGVVLPTGPEIASAGGGGGGGGNGGSGGGGGGGHPTEPEPEPEPETPPDETPGPEGPGPGGPETP